MSSTNGNSNQRGSNSARGGRGSGRGGGRGGPSGGPSGGGRGGNARGNAQGARGGNQSGRGNNQGARGGNSNARGGNAGGYNDRVNDNRGGRGGRVADDRGTNGNGGRGGRGGKNGGGGRGRAINIKSNTTSTAIKNHIQRICEYGQANADYQPVHDWRADLKSAMEVSRSAIIVGPTGCGKSTQVPPYLLDLYPDSNILVVQPRRIPCIKIAEFIAEQQGWTYGQEVGIRIGRLARTTMASRIVLATAGCALHMLTSSAFSFNIVIIDEIHERDLPVELFAAALRIRMRSDPTLRVLAMSATVVENVFAAYFSFPPPSAPLDNSRVYHAPVINMATTFGGHHIYEAHLGDKFAEVRDATRRFETANCASTDALQTWNAAFQLSFPLMDYTNAVKPAVVKLLTAILSGDTKNGFFAGMSSEAKNILFGTGAIMVFLPGLGEIDAVRDAIECRQFNKLAPGLTPPTGATTFGDVLEIGVLHSQLSPEVLNMVACAHVVEGKRRLILTTNLAETSLTIADATVVIDIGLSRSIRVKDGNKMLDTVLATDQARMQRRGRVGRVAPGVYIDMRPSSMHGFAAQSFMSKLEISDLQVILSENIMDLFGANLDPQFFFNAKNQLSHVEPVAISKTLSFLKAIGVAETVKLPGDLHKFKIQHMNDETQESLDQDFVPFFMPLPEQKQDSLNIVARCPDIDGTLSTTEYKPVTPTWYVNSAIDVQNTMFAFYKGRAVFITGDRLSFAATDRHNDKTLLRVDDSTVIAVDSFSGACTKLPVRKATSKSYTPAKFVCSGTYDDLIDRTLNVTENTAEELMIEIASLSQEEIDGFLVASTEESSLIPAFAALLAGANPCTVSATTGRLGLRGFGGCMVTALCAKLSGVSVDDLDDLDVWSYFDPEDVDDAKLLAEFAIVDSIAQFDPHFRDLYGCTLANYLSISNHSERNQVLKHFRSVFNMLESVYGVATTLGATVVYKQKSGALFVDTKPATGWPCEVNGITYEAIFDPSTPAPKTAAVHPRVVPLDKSPYPIHLAVAPTALGMIGGTLPLEPAEAAPTIMLAIAGMPALAAMLLAGKRENVLLNKNEIGNFAAEANSAFFSVWPPLPVTDILHEDSTVVSDYETAFNMFHGGSKKSGPIKTYIDFFTKHAGGFFQCGWLVNALAAASVRIVFPTAPLSQTAVPDEGLAGFCRKYGISIARMSACELLGASIVTTLSQFGICADITAEERSTMFVGDAELSLPEDWTTCQLKHLPVSIRMLREINNFVFKLSGVDMFEREPASCTETERYAVNAAIAHLEAIVGMLIGGRNGGSERYGQGQDNTPVSLTMRDCPDFELPVDCRSPDFKNVTTIGSATNPHTTCLLPGLAKQMTKITAEMTPVKRMIELEDSETETETENGHDNEVDAQSDDDYESEHSDSVSDYEYNSDYEYDSDCEAKPDTSTKVTYRTNPGGFFYNSLLTALSLRQQSAFTTSPLGIHGLRGKVQGINIVNHANRIASFTALALSGNTLITEPTPARKTGRASITITWENQDGKEDAATLTGPMQHVRIIYNALNRAARALRHTLGAFSVPEQMADSIDAFLTDSFNGVKFFGKGCKFGLEGSPEHNKEFIDALIVLSGMGDCTDIHVTQNGNDEAPAKLLMKHTRALPRITESAL